MGLVRVALSTLGRRFSAQKISVRVFAASTAKPNARRVLVRLTHSAQF
jgi:hypothetical protein